MKKDIEQVIESVDDIRKSIIYSNYEIETDIRELFSDEELSELMGRLEDKQRREIFNQFFNSANPEAAVTRFRKTVEMVSKRRRRSLLVRWGSAAILAGAVIAVSMLVYNNKHRSISEKNIVSMNKRELRDILQPTIITHTGDSVVLTNIDSVFQNKIAELQERNVINRKIKNSIFDELIIPAGCTKWITLDDGTEVKVNAGSSLRFPSSFADNRREVELSGEAYFKVAKSDIPFVVKVKNMEARVYGTEFNINANQLNSIETVLVEGSVGISSKNREEVILVPNQIAIYNTLTNENEVKNVNVDDYVAWKDSLFLYKERPLRLVLHDLAAWYGVTFEPRCKIEQQITCLMSRKTNINDMLQMIEFATQVKFIKENSQKYVIE